MNRTLYSVVGTETSSAACSQGLCLLGRRCQGTPSESSLASACCYMATSVANTARSLAPTREYEELMSFLPYLQAWVWLAAHTFVPVILYSLGAEFQQMVLTAQRVDVGVEREHILMVTYITLQLVVLWLFFKTYASDPGVSCMRACMYARSYYASECKATQSWTITATQAQSESAMHHMFLHRAYPRGSHFTPKCHQHLDQMSVADRAVIHMQGAHSNDTSVHPACFTAKAHPHVSMNASAPIWRHALCRHHNCRAAWPRGAVSALSVVCFK